MRIRILVCDPEATGLYEIGTYGELEVPGMTYSDTDYGWAQTIVRREWKRYLKHLRTEGLKGDKDFVDWLIERNPTWQRIENQAREIVVSYEN